MPGASFYRIQGSTFPPDDPGNGAGEPGGVYLPDGAVLFGYNSRYDGNSYRLNGTYLGITNPRLTDFYTKYEDLFLTTFVSSRTYGIGNGAHSALTFLRCASTNSNWFFGKYQNSGWNTANSSLNAIQPNVSGNPPVYATLLDGHIGDTNWQRDFDNYRLSGRHGYLSPHPISGYDMNYPSRNAADIPTILGAAPGDTLSTTAKYTIQDQAHEGHYHRVSGLDVNQSIININFGKDDGTNFETGGLHLLPVIPYIKNPYNSKKPNALLTSLPKGVLVFGQDLSQDNDVVIWTRDQYNPTEEPNGDYTRHDYDHEQDITSRGASASSDTSDMNDNYNTYVQTPLYLTVSPTDVGLIVPSQTTFTVNAVSNVNGLHVHTGNKQAFKSTKTGQIGDALGPSGAHNHVVYYTGEISLKAKWLNGWITLKDDTPIANGIIIGFAPALDPGRNTSLDSSLAAKTDADWLPQYWHFCDGTNGTPDLRGYHIAVNMYESEAALHGTEVNSVNQINFSDITVGPSSGEVDVLYTAADRSVINSPRKTHTHILGKDLTGIGTPIKMLGSHGADPARWHIHQISPQTTFTDTVSTFPIIPNATSSPTPILTTTTYTNIKTGINYSYNPDVTRLAFIMLNKAIP